MARDACDPSDDGSPTDEPHPDTATCCIDCGRRNDNATPGETCAECGGTFHNYARVPGGQRAVEAALGALATTLLKNDETGRSYRPRTLVVEDVEANEQVALAPGDLTSGWTVRPDPYATPRDVQEQEEAGD